ncbi:FxsA family protein [Allorhizocola rhizosphaerae]|uniref:FxsA family protein n=1 Tax=Allorhizocola rhizosphaerae TaxID=1872709 RepID=UPI000E3C50E7|nr:FxsA family protein [Allorhizocola rhizosphaerae]
MRKVRLRWIPIGAILLGVAEFAVLLGVVRLVGRPIGIIGLLVLSLMGAVMLRSEGIRAWRRMREARQAQGPVGEKVLDGVVGLTAGVLLLVPGYLTALAGLLLFVPPIRSLVRKRLRAASERRVPSNVAGDLFGPRSVRVQKTPPTKAPADEVIEGEIVD